MEYPVSQAPESFFHFDLSYFKIYSQAIVYLNI